MVLLKLALQIKNCLKNTPAIKIATMKNMDNFNYEWKPSHTTAKSTPFAVSKDEWNAKEDTIKNVLYMYCGMPKACVC